MKNTNKGRRNELAKLKYKKRIELRGFTEEEQQRFKLYVYKSHGAPCSCWACRGLKYRDVDRQKNKLIEIEI